MQRITLIGLVALMSTGLIAGCASSTGTQQAAEVSQKFTEVEKAQMSEAEKLAIYNQIRDQDEKLVCTRDIVTGSHFKRKYCRTVAQRRAEREAAQEALDRMQRSTVVGPDDGI